MSLEQEQQIGALCATIWPENAKNKIAGLIEEVMEAAEASHTLTEQQTIDLTTACIRRAWADRPKEEEESTRKGRFTKELTDVFVMLCSVRFGQGYQIGSFLENGSKVILASFDKWNKGGYDRDKLAQKLKRKEEQGIRIPFKLMDRPEH